MKCSIHGHSQPGLFPNIRYCFYDDCFRVASDACDRSGLPTP